MQQDSRTTNVIRNISSGMFAQGMQMLLSFVTRTVFINFLSAEYLGINSLFSNVLAMLSLTELGITSAFIYELYKPLSENNKTQIAVIIKYFKKAYHWVGIIIFISGLLLIPFLNQIIAKKPINIIEDIRIIYLFFLFNSASGYFFSYKISLLDADQKISVSILNSVKFLIIQNVLQILVLVFTQNFLFYLSVQLLVQLLSNFWISRIVDKKYPFLSEHNHLRIEASIRKNIVKNVKATFLQKIGLVLVNGTDNLFISYFVGLAILGKFSNYVMLFSLANGILMIIFANLKSSVANFVTKEPIERQREVFRTINFLNFLFFGISSLLIFFCINDFVNIWIGEKYILPMNITLFLAVNFFMVGMQNSFWTFKSAFGFFTYGKYLVMVTAIINLFLSYFLGRTFGIVGILVSTAIARIVTNFWYDPYIVLKNGLKQNPIHYLLRFSLYIFVLGLAYYISWFILRNFVQHNLISLATKFFTTLIISLILILLFFGKSVEIQKTLEFLKNFKRFSNLKKAKKT